MMESGHSKKKKDMNKTWRDMDVVLRALTQKIQRIL